MRAPLRRASRSRPVRGTSCCPSPITRDSWAGLHREFRIYPQLPGEYVMPAATVGRYVDLQRLSNGYAEDLYFEADSGLLRMVIEGSGRRAKRAYCEYRDVGGIRVPHVWATVFDNGDPPHVFVVDDVKLNVALDDGFFLSR